MKNLPTSEEVDQLLLNARLRDALEPYIDESLSLLNATQMTTMSENEFLASMLAWEQAPVLPIGRWFQPELVIPHPDRLDDPQLHNVLWETINRLYSARVVLEFTDHLSDRELYCVIYRDILPSPEKMIDLPKNYLHWRCLDDTEPEIWLTYYATEEERRLWQAETGQRPPRALPRPFPRRLPQHRS